MKGLNKRATIIYATDYLWSGVIGWGLTGFIKLLVYMPAFWRSAAIDFLGLPYDESFPFPLYFFGLVRNHPSYWPHWRLVFFCSILVFGLRLLDCRLKCPGASPTSEAFLNCLDASKPPKWRYEATMKQWSKPLWLIAIFLVVYFVLAGVITGFRSTP